MSLDTPIWPRLSALTARLGSVDRDNLPTFWMDADGTMGYANRSTCETFGFFRSDLAGQKIDRNSARVPLNQWKDKWWEISQADERIDLFPSRWKHQLGHRLNCSTEVVLVPVSNLEFLVFSLSQQNTSEPTPPRHTRKAQCIPPRY